MSTSSGSFDPAPSETVDLYSVVSSYDDAWRRGKTPNLTDYLKHPHLDRKTLLLELALNEMEWRHKRGEHPSADDYLRRFAELKRDAQAAEKLRRRAEELARLRSAKQPEAPANARATAGAASLAV